MERMTILYDNWCPNCTRFAMLMKRLDWFHLVLNQRLRDKNETTNAKVNRERAKKQMASFYNEKWHYGYISLYLIFIRIPLFWILFPFLWLLKISSLGQLFYKKLALERKVIPIYCDSKSCNLNNQ